MPKFKLVFSEDCTRIRRIEVEVEAADHEQAAQAALKAYQDGQYDVLLEEAEEETEGSRNEVAYHNEAGEYVILLPWD